MEDNTPIVPDPEPMEEEVVEEVELQTEKEPDSSEKEKNDDTSVEESLTPPLLPNMKVKNPSELQNEKKLEKESKVKRNQWDMFAEQDIFKADTNVCFSFIIFIDILPAALNFLTQFLNLYPKNFKIHCNNVA